MSEISHPYPPHCSTFVSLSGTSQKQQRTGPRQTLPSPPHAAILPGPTGKVNRFHTNSGHFSPANPHTPLIPLTPLEAGGRKDQAEGGKPFSPRLPPRRPRHLRHPAPMYLRNVRTYILFDCPWGIFADNHIKLLETWSRMRRL